MCRREEALRFLIATSMPWQVSGYSLLIQAVDSGIPAMSSTTTVNIDISDVNDNSPVFTPANYTAVIQVSKSCVRVLPVWPSPLHLFRLVGLGILYTLTQSRRLQQLEFTADSFRG